MYVVQKSSYQKLGIQVPTEVHKKALEHERLTRGDRDYINQQKDAREKREAKACLQGMFGKIPEEECETIVNRAFERVGTPF